jgi:hypothetical protein
MIRAFITGSFAKKSLTTQCTVINTKNKNKNVFTHNSYHLQISILIVCNVLMEASVKKAKK